MKTFRIEGNHYSYDVSIFENNENETYLVKREIIDASWRSGYGDTVQKAVARFLYRHGAKVSNWLVSKGKVDVTYRDDIPRFNLIGFKKSIEYILNTEEEDGDDLYSFWNKCELKFIKEQKETTVLLPFSYDKENRACQKYSKEVAEKYSGEYLKPYLQSCDFCPLKKGCKGIKEAYENINDHAPVSTLKRILRNYLEELELEDYVVETTTDDSIFSKVEFDKTKWEKEISVVEEWISGKRHSFYIGDIRKYLDYNVCSCARINERFSQALKNDYPIKNSSDNCKGIHSECRTCPLCCENIEGNKKGFLCEKNSYFSMAINAKYQEKDGLAKIYWEEFKNSIVFKPFVSLVEESEKGNPISIPISSSTSHHQKSSSHRKYAVVRNNPVKWTKKELNILVKTIKNNPQKGVFTELAKKLNRSEEGIIRKCRREFGTSDLSILSSVAMKPSL